MIDNNLAQFLDVLSKENFPGEKQKLVQAITGLSTQATNVQFHVKNDMKIAIDDNDFDQLHTLETTHNLLESLKTDLSAYALFAEATPDEPEITVPSSTSKNTKPKKQTTDNDAMCQSVKEFFDRYYEYSNNVQDSISTAQVYQKYCTYVIDNPNAVKMTNYTFYAYFEEISKVGRSYVDRRHFFTNLRTKRVIDKPLDSQSLSIDQIVEHKKYGIGNIIKIDKYNVVIKFLNIKEPKTFKIDAVIDNEYFTMPQFGKDSGQVS